MDKKLIDRTFLFSIIAINRQIIMNYVNPQNGKATCYQCSSQANLQQKKRGD